MAHEYRYLNISHRTSVRWAKVVKGTRTTQSGPCLVTKGFSILKLDQMSILLNVMVQYVASSELWGGAVSNGRWMRGFTFTKLGIPKHDEM